MKIIALVGKTSTGKDTVMRYIREAYGIDQIVSYTTREKRVSEEDGREHFFISEEEMDRLFANKNDLLAYATFKNTGIRYCTTTEGVSDDAVFTYIINPIALAEMKNRRPDVEIISILLYLDERIIKKRAHKRGESLEKIEERLGSERDEFDEYLKSEDYDAKINTNKKRQDIYREVHKVLYEKGLRTKSEKILEEK